MQTMCVAHSHMNVSIVRNWTDYMQILRQRFISIKRADCFHSRSRSFVNVILSKIVSIIFKISSYWNAYFSGNLICGEQKHENALTT